MQPFCSLSILINTQSRPMVITFDRSNVWRFGQLSCKSWDVSVSLPPSPLTVILLPMHECVKGFWLRKYSSQVRYIIVRATNATQSMLYSTYYVRHLLNHLILALPTLTLLLVKALLIDPMACFPFTALPYSSPKNCSKIFAIFHLLHVSHHQSYLKT